MVGGSEVVGGWGGEGATPGVGEQKMGHYVGLLSLKTAAAAEDVAGR